MVLIGENIHIIARAVSEAIRERNKRVIEDLAIAQAEAGMNYIDLNLGPARREPEETMRWLVETVQGVVSLPIYLTAHPRN